MDLSVFGENLWLIAIGFSLLSAGAPIPTVAMYSLLVSRASHLGLPWWHAALVAGAGTVAGQLGAMLLFRTLGLPAFDAIGRHFPETARVVNDMRHRLTQLLSRRRSWVGLVGLRWASVGYAQLFWLLGTLPGLYPDLLAFLVINDFIWAAGWTYAFVAFRSLVPRLMEFVDAVVPLLFAIYLGVALFTWLHHRGTKPTGH